ncbi:efflux RND transporter periplasmic adaptor subunit [Actinomadura decatromicini]|uniref:efflux RND transporter periplasmic adaptor subunit n=1 Tax=Actinomadura decatromicini TaxID=2604572 RepID=UPI001FE73D2E|nr:HlyD family efflux transporter periplasmic adaptor subunit [Actinomadura decatromicini]
MDAQISPGKPPPVKAPPSPPGRGQAGHRRGKPVNRRKAVVNGVLAAVLLATCGYGYLALSDDGEPAAQTRTGTVSRGTLLATVSASGSVTGAKTADLSFGTSGTVESIDVKAGETVSKGQVLATLDDTAARDSVRSAKASLDAAAEGDTSTASGYSTYVSAKAQYNDALRQFAGTTMKAPYAGTITVVNGTVGGPSGGSSGTTGTTGSAGSSSGQPGGGGSGGTGGSGGSGSSGGSSSSGSGSGFMTIADTSHLEVGASFTEADITKIKKGRPATITFDALPGVTASGAVTAIDQTSTTENNVVRYGVRIALTERPDGVRLGQTSQVQVTTGKAENVLYVPAAAVRTAGGRSTVTVVANGTQTVKTVQTGLTGDQGTEITSGLAEGESVLITTTTGSSGQNGRFPGGGFPGGGPGGARLGGGGGGGRP